MKYLIFELCLDSIESLNPLNYKDFKIQNSLLVSPFSITIYVCIDIYSNIYIYILIYIPYFIPIFIHMQSNVTISRVSD